MKIFLTGATGFVGSVVAEKLKGKGYKVSALARNDDAAAKLEAKNIEVLRGELGDFDVLKQGASEADAVIHTAFSHNFADYNDAVKLDREVIKTFGEALAQTNKPLIVTSSSSVLGDTRTNEADEDYPFGENSSRKLRGESERDVLQFFFKGHSRHRFASAAVCLRAFGQFVRAVCHQSGEVGRCGELCRIGRTKSFGGSR